MEFYSALPLAEEIEIGDPLAAARSLTWLPHPFLLHSAASSDRARWSFFGRAMTQDWAMPPRRNMVFRNGFRRS